MRPEALSHVRPSGAVRAQDKLIQTADSDEKKYKIQQRYIKLLVDVAGAVQRAEAPQVQVNQPFGGFDIERILGEAEKNVNPIEKKEAILIGT